MTILPDVVTQYLNPDEEETIVKYVNSYADRFKQELNDPHWEKDRVERQKTMQKLLSSENIDNLTELDFRNLMKGLWALNGWHNKDWVVDNILRNTDFKKVRESLKNLLYSSDELDKRFDASKIKHLGTSMITEIISMVDPEKYCLWNEKPRKVLPLFGISQIPDRVYKHTQIYGHEYLKCNEIMKEILGVLRDQGFEKINLLDLDLFIWVVYEETKQSRVEKKQEPKPIPQSIEQIAGLKPSEMSHWDAIGVIVELGSLLGYDTYVADPSREYKGKPLREWTTSTEVPEQCENIPGIERIDAIWYSFEPPIHLFEVEDGGNMRDALHRLYQARFFQSKFFIVCPADNRNKFEKFVTTDPYKAMREKYLFRTYEDLLKMYDTVQNYKKIRTQFFNE